MIIGLDIATVTGIAYGPAGSVPSSYSVRLKDGDEANAVAQMNLFRELEKRFRESLPVLVAKERALHLAAVAKLGNSAASIELTTKLHGVVETICGLFEVPLIDAPDSTIRKHFIGRANAGSRPETKAAVVERCKLLGYLPEKSRDHDRADALATWDWASATYFGKPSKLRLFAENGR